MTTLDDLGARLTAAAHLTDPLTQIRELSALRASAPTVLAAAIDAAVARADETHDRTAIADALGATSDAEVRRRLTAHRARIGQPGRPGRRPKEESVPTYKYAEDSIKNAIIPFLQQRTSGPGGMPLTPDDIRRRYDLPAIHADSFEWRRSGPLASLPAATDGFQQAVSDEGLWQIAQRNLRDDT